TFPLGWCRRVATPLEPNEYKPCDASDSLPCRVYSWPSHSMPRGSIEWRSPRRGEEVVVVLRLEPLKVGAIPPQGLLRLGEGALRPVRPREEEPQQRVPRRGQPRAVRLPAQRKAPRVDRPRQPVRPRAGRVRRRRDRTTPAAILVAPRDNEPSMPGATAATIEP